jgi:hypothetical protein
MTYAEIARFLRPKKSFGTGGEIAEKDKKGRD